MSAGLADLLACVAAFARSLEGEFDPSASSATSRHRRRPSCRTRACSSRGSRTRAARSAASSQAAATLGPSRTRFYRLMRRYGLG